MSAQDTTINKILVAVLTIGITSLGIWTVAQTQRNTVETANVHKLLAQISQKVDDGKENRLAYQVVNDTAHKTILDSLSTLVPRTEFELRIKLLDDRIRVLDEKLRVIEAQNKSIDERTRLIEERAKLIDEKVRIIESRLALSKAS